MRLRNVPNAHDKLELSPNYVSNPQNYKGRWHEFFGNKNPIHLEIGAGKGRFITTIAQQNKDINYIAIEKYPSVLLKLIGKIPEEGLKNLAVISIDAKLLEEVFTPGEVDRLYLNFSDPWPKYKHTKRRLTAPGFLMLYKKILKDGASIEFKTDNRVFFDYSIEEFRNADYTLKDITFDLYNNSSMLEGNIATEYEEKFHKLGTPINKLVAQFEDNHKEDSKDDL